MAYIFLIVFANVYVFRLVSTGSFIYAKTDIHRKFVNMNELGVPITGKTSLLLEVKTCSEASFILSEKRNVGSNNGRFFMIIIGARNGTLNGIKDSCYKRCWSSSGSTGRATVRKGHWLSCFIYRKFWFSWDEKTVIFGFGSRVGSMKVMNLTNSRPFLVNFLTVIGGKRTIEWKFLINKPPTFVFPMSFGGSVISVPEDLERKKVICDMKATDPDKDVVMFSVTGQYSEIFRSAGSSLVLRGSLDYETKSMYTVQVTATDGTNSVITYLTVIVTDVNDNPPKVANMNPIVIPEQMPIGSIIGVLLEASDVDTNDRVTYALEGKDDAYFAVDQWTGVVSMKKELDLENIPLGKFAANLTVVASDTFGHLGYGSLSITAFDVNDNPPVFSQTTYHVSVKEGGIDDEEMVSFKVTDNDRDPQNTITLGVLQESNVFRLRGVTLLARAGALDYEDTSMYDHQTVVKVIATDRKKKGRQNTSTATVIIHIVAVNEHRPTWSNSSLKTINVSNDINPGEIIHTLFARDADDGADGNVKYMLLSVRDEQGNKTNGLFAIEKTSGQIRTLSTFNNSVSESYSLHVEAYDLGTPQTATHGIIRVVLYRTGSGKADEYCALPGGVRDVETYCASLSGALTLRVMTGVLSACLLVTSLVVIFGRKTVVKVHSVKYDTERMSDSFECKACAPIQQIPPRATAEGFVV